MENMNIVKVAVFLLSGIACGAVSAASPNLGELQSFAVLGNATVTNAGATSITGDVGVTPGSAITGTPTLVLANGTLHSNTELAQQAMAKAVTLNTDLTNLTKTTDLSGTDLGGLTLAPGVYDFSSGAFLSGNLTLNALGNPNAVFVFRTGSTLNTADGGAASVSFMNASTDNVFWQVGSSATIGTNTKFVGNIIANNSITLNTGASVLNGRAIALTGAVTMDTNTIYAGLNTVSPVPEPHTYALMLAGLGLLGFMMRRKSA
jgi:hypothetical protein